MLLEGGIAAETQGTACVLRRSLPNARDVFVAVNTSNEAIAVDLRVAGSVLLGTSLDVTIQDSRLMLPPFAAAWVHATAPSAGG